MQDRELIRMAAFKLQESARRLGSLARESDNAEIRRHFKTLADDLLKQEKRLWELQAPEAPKAVKGATAAPAASPSWSGRTKRRAVG